jgi:hypothetical protein
VVRVRAMDARTQRPVQGPVQVTVFRSRPGQPDEQVHAGTFAQNPERFVLGEGLFRIAASAGGSPKSDTVTAAIGSDREIELWFDGRAANRLVDIQVVVHRPSLLANAFQPPQIELRGAKISGRYLRAGANPLNLPPGDYEVVVASRQPHRLPFSLSDNGSQFAATVEVVPGWFEADAGRNGHFVLFDASGKALAQFDGAKVSHSLPDGSYRLELKDPGGSSLSGQFERSLGRMQDVRLN